MLKNKRYYLEKTNKCKENSKIVTTEVERFLNTVEFEEIERIQHDINSYNKHSYHVVLSDKFDGYNNKTYSTKKMSKEAFEMFNEVLPLNKHERIDEPLITKGLLDEAKDPHKIFKKY